MFPLGINDALLLGLSASFMVVDVSPVPRHAEVCYKAVAVHASRLLSIFDGVTEYRLDEVTHRTSGLWACPSLAAL